jgi:hypothetical protein
MEIDLLAIQASTKAFNTSISQFRNTAERVLHYNVIYYCQFF